MPRSSPRSPPPPLLIHEHRQQEAAERVAREARARHWSPRVLPADAADLRLLPREHAAVFVVATAGQGEFPANCRSLWRFLSRAALPASCLAGLRVAVFGFGDSGYPLFNAAARKLSRRLVEGLGAAPLVPLGLGDDQGAAVGAAPPEAALDAWLLALWPALRETTAPLPAGVPEEAWGAAGGGGEVGRLGPCRFSVELVARAGAAPPRRPAPGAASPFLPSREEALEAHAAFHRLEALASGELAAPPGYEEQGGAGSGEGGGGGGAARPLLAATAANRRLTPPSHWQDTRHLSLRVAPSPSGHGPPGRRRRQCCYSPGDVAALLPEQSAASVRAVLAPRGLGPGDRVRVSARAAAASARAAAASACAAASPPASPGPSLSFETTAAALVAGVLELDGASPRRRLFEVLAAFAAATADAEKAEEEGKEEPAAAAAAPASLARERLRLFASAEGRADLALYCGSGEPRTLSEVLSDFPSAAAAAPLAWLLAAAPRLRPRRFSIASAPTLSPSTGAAPGGGACGGGGGHGGEEEEAEGAEAADTLDLTVAVVRYRTPHGRPRLGLASGWLSGLRAEGEGERAEGARPEEGEGAAGGAGGGGSLLPLWVERGALSLPSLAAAAARQMQGLRRRQSPPLLAPLEAWLATPLILVGPGTGIAPMRSLLQARRAERAKRGDPAAAAAVAPCSLYFGCRSPVADCYYRSEFEGMVGDGTLRAYRTAFSREEEEEQEQEQEEEGGEGGGGKGGGGGGGGKVGDGNKAKRLKPKRYVTHLLREDAGELWRLLSPPDGSDLPPATVLVAGSAKNMPRDVRLAFEDVAAERGGLGAEGGRAFVRRMVSSGRYVVEAWS